MRFRALLLLAIAAGVHAGPVNYDQACAQECIPSTKFGYETGVTYRFDYAADTVTALSQVADEHSALHVRTIARVYVLSPCELVLWLGDTSLEEYSAHDLTTRSPARNSRAFATAVEDRSLRFSFQDGRVAEVCGSVEEESWVLNFKKGVLSAFQNSMPTFDDGHTVKETDVTGNCEAEYGVENLGFNSVTVTKTKQLQGCTDRNGFFSSLQATTYNVPSDIQSLPLLRSSHTCTQTINAGILVRSECTEEHLFRPFSNQDNGAVTRVTQTLEYLGSSREQPTATGPTRTTTLLYEHEPRNVAQNGDISLATEILGELCVYDDVRPNTPELFSRLVYALRQLDESSLNQLHRRVDAGRICNNDIAMKLFHDAVPVTGTAASVALMSRLINSGEISGDEAELWVSSLPFIPEPNEEMLQQARSLLSSSERHVYLSVSGLVNSYCRVHSACTESRVIQDIVSTFLRQLGSSCRADSEPEVQQVLAALKALGNSGAGQEAVETLGRCMTMQDNRIEIRLAAIEAFRRIPCQFSRGDLLRRMSDVNEDVEVRIAAYLGAMQCSSHATITTVKQTLESEQVNQVGSFIWTHLTNLMETTDPFKKDIRAILEDDVIAKEFNMDARKFSRNFEGSAFFDTINAGAKYESNLIWSPASFLPRSAMFNLTVDMFGKSVNLFEIGGRAEGLERYLEMLFGPNGYFPNKAVNEAINERMASIDEGLKRKIQTDPSASAYLKVFGNEIRFWNTDFNQQEDAFNILNFFIKLAQDQQAEITKSMMFMDSEMTVPTSAGLPLKLAVNGTVAVNIKIGGKMDLRRCATLPASLLIDGYLKPSAAVTVSSEMGVDLHAARTGLRMLSTLHSSTQMNGKVELQDTTILTTSFDMPEQRQEIVNVESKIFVLHNDEEIEQEIPEYNRHEEITCSSEKFIQITGAKICKSVYVPETVQQHTPSFPLSGPMSASLSLEKADTHSKYEIELRYEAQKERRDGKLSYNNIFRAAFNTPGSRVNRQFLVDVMLDQDDMKLSVNLVSPWKHATLDGSLSTAPELLGGSLILMVDQSQIINLLAEVGKETTGDVVRVTPRVEIMTPWFRPVSLRGQARASPGPNFDIDFTLDAFSQPITLTGGIQQQGIRYETELTLRSPVLNTHLAGFTAMRDSMLSTNMELSYDLNDARTQSFLFSCKAKDTSNDRAAKFSFQTALQSSAYPDYNIDFSTDFMLNAKHLESSASLAYGEGNDAGKQITMTHSVDYKGDYSAFEYDHTWSFSWPYMGVDVNGQASHSHEMDRHLRCNAMVAYLPGRAVNFNVDVNKESIYPLQVTGDITLSYPGREMRLYKTVNENTPGIYDTRTIIQWQANRQVTLESVYKMEGSRHSLTSELTYGDRSTSTFDGSVNLDILDFTLEATVNHNDKAYSTSLNYNVRPAAMETSGGLDVNIPGRHVNVQTSGSLRPGDYSAYVMTQWDADRDPSQKIVLNIKLATTDERHEGMFRIMYPERRIVLTFEQAITENGFTHHSEIAWTARNSLITDITLASRSQGKQGNMRIQSPFYQDITMSGEWKTGYDGSRGHVELNYGSIWSADVTCIKVEGARESSITIQTPIREWESLAAAVRHQFDAPEKQVVIEVTRNEQNAKLTLQGALMFERRKTELSGLATLTTSFTPDLVFETSFSHEDRSLTSSLRCMYNGEELNSALQVELDGSIFNQNGQLTVTTPIPSLSSIESNWKLEVGSLTDFLLEHDIAVNSKKLTYKLINQKYNSNMQTSLHIETTFTAFRNVDLTTTSSFTSTTLNTETAFTFNDAKHFEITTEFADRGLDCEAKIVLKSKFSMARDVSLYMFRKESQQPPLNHAEFKWAPNKVVTLEYEGEMTPAVIKGEWRLMTPFSGLERTVLNIDFTNSYGNWQTASYLEYSTSKRIAVEGRLNAKEKLSALLKIESPCPYFRTFELGLDHFGIGTRFNHSCWLSYTRENQSDIKYAANVAMNDDTLLLGSIEINSPCPYFRDHKISVEHQLINNEYVSKLRAQIHPRHEINIGTTFQNSNSRFKLQGEVQSTFEAMQSLEFDFDHQGNALRLIGRGSIESHVAQFPISYSHAYNINGFRLVTIDAELETPLNEKTMYNFAHRINGAQIATNTLLQLTPAKVIQLENSINMANGLTMSTKLTTPFEELRAVAITINHDGLAIDSFTCQSQAQVDSVYGPFNVNVDARVNGLFDFYGMLDVNRVFSINLNSNRNRNKYNSIATVNWGRNAVHLSHEYDTEYKRRTVTFSSPFQGFENIQYTETLSLSEDAMELTSMLRYGNNNEISLEGSLILVPNFYTSLKVVTPFMPLSYMYGELSHSGVLTDCNCKAKVEFTSNRKTTNAQVVSQLRFGRSNIVKVELTSSFSRMEDTSVDAKFDLVGTRSYKADMKMNYNSHQIHLASQASLDDLAAITGSLSVDGPVSFVLTAYHNGHLPQFDHSVDVNLNGKQMKYLGNFQQYPVKGNFKLETPFEPARQQELLFDFEGVLSDFSGKVKISHNDRNMCEVDIALNVKRGLELSATLNTPFTETMSLTINHVGDYVFQHRSSATYGRKAIELSGQFGLNPVQGEILLNTPFREARTVKLSLESSGRLEQFESKLTFKLNRQQTSLTVSVYAVENFEAKVVVSSSMPSLNGISLEMKHVCNLPEFQTRVFLNYGQKTVLLNTGFSLSPMKKAYLNFQSECPYLRDIDITAQINDNLPNLEANIVANINGQRATASSRLNTADKNIDGQFNVNIPGLPPVNGILQHTFAGPMLDTKMEVTYGQEKIDASLDFDLNSWQGGITFKSPCPYLRDISLTLAQGDRNGVYEPALTFSHDRLGITTLNGRLQQSPLVAEISLHSPCPYLKSVVIKLEHSGTTDFHNSFTVSYETEEVFATDVTFRLVPLNIDATARIPGNEIAIVVVDKESGNWMEFDIDHRLKLNDRLLASAQIKFSQESRAAEVHITSQWFDNVDITFANTGTWENMATQTSVRYGSRSLLQCDLDFSLAPTNIRVKIQTPFPSARSFEINLNTQGQLSNFQLQSVASYNSNEIFDIRFVFGLTASEIRTQIQRFNAGSVRIPDCTLLIRHEGNINSFISHVEASWGRMALTGDISFSDSSARLEITITTPFRGYERLGASFNHNSDLSAFTTNGEIIYANDQVITISSSKNSSRFVAEVESPFGNGKITVKLTGVESTTSASLNLKLGRQEYSADASVEFNPALVARLQVITPVRGFEEIICTLNHAFDNGHIESNIRGAVNGQAVEIILSGNYNGVQSFDGDLTLKTPFKNYEQYQINVNHRGALQDMQCSVRAVYPPENILTGTFVLNTNNGIQTELKTNIRGLEDVGAEISISGDISDMRGMVRLYLSPQKEISVTTTGAMTGNKINAQVIFRSPFEGYESGDISFDLEGAVQSFRGSAEVNWIDRQLVSIALEGGLPHRLSLTANDLSLLWNVDSNDRGFDGSTSITLARETIAQGNFNGYLQGNLRSLNLKLDMDITTKFDFVRSIIFNIEHRHNSENVFNRMSVVHNRADLLGSDISLTPRSGSINVNHPLTIYGSYQVNGNTIQMTLQQPIRTDARLTLEPGKIAFNMATPYPCDFTVLHSGDSASFEMIEPTVVKAIVRFSGRAGMVKVEEPFKFTTSFDLDGGSGIVEMKYPYDIRGEYRIAADRGEVRMSGLYDLEAAYTLDANGGSLNVTGPYRVSARYNFEGTRGSIDIEYPIEIKAEYSFGMNGGSFEMTKPVEIDIRASLTDNTAEFIMQKPTEVDVSVQFSWNEIEISINSPLVVHAKASYANNGVSFTMNEPYETDLKLTFSPNHIAFEMTEPLPVLFNINLENNKINVLSKGLLDAEAHIGLNELSLVVENPVDINIRCSVSLSRVTVAITAPLNFVAEAALENGRLSLTIPGPYPIETQLQRTDTGFSFTMNKPTPVGMTFDFQGLHGGFRMNEPFEMEISYDLNSEEGGFNLLGPYSADASYTLGRHGASFSMRNPFKVDARITLENTEGEIDIESPFVVRARYAIHEKGASFVMEEPVSVDARFTMEGMNAELRVLSSLLEIDARSTWNGESGSFTVNKPIRLSTSFTLAPTAGFFTMREPMYIDALYSFTGREVSFQMRAPIEIEASFTNYNNRGTIQVTKPFDLNANYQITETGGSFLMQTPFEAEASYEFDGTNGRFNMVKPIIISAQGMFDGHRASLNVVEPFVFSANGEFDGRRGRFTMTQPCDVNTEWHYDGQEIAVNMDRPYRIQVSGQYSEQYVKAVMTEPYLAKAECNLAQKTFAVNADAQTQINFQGSWNVENMYIHMDKPTQISLTCSLIGETLALEMRQPYAFTATIQNNNVAFEMSHPFVVSVNGLYDGSSASVNLNAPYTAAIQANFNNGLYGLNMLTPYKADLELVFNANEKSANIDIPSKLSATTSFKDNKISFQMREPYILRTYILFNGEEFAFNMEGPITVSLNGFYNGDIISFTMAQPYYLTMRVGLSGREIALNLEDILPLVVSGSYNTSGARFDMQKPYMLSASGLVNGQRASLNMNGQYPIIVELGFDGRRGMINMQEPYMFNAEGHLDSQSASLNIGGPYPISVDGVFDGRKGQFVMRQPYQMSLNGDVDQGTALVDFGGPYPISVDYLFNGTHGQFNMRQPYQFSAGGNFNGTGASVNVGGPYLILVYGLFNGNRGKIVMVHPYQFSADGHLDGRSASLNIGGPYPISAEGSFDGNRGQIVMHQPYEFSADAHLKGQSASLNIGGPYPISAEGSYDGNRGQIAISKPIEFSAHGDLAGRSASLNVGGPYPISAEGSFDGNRGQYVMRQPYEFSADGYLDGRSASLNVGGPYPISAEGSFDGNRGKIVIRQPYQFNADGHVDRQSASINIGGPYPISAEGSFDGNRGQIVMRQPYEFSAHGDLAHRSASLNVGGPYPISAEGSFNESHGRLIMNQPYEFSADGYLDGRSASLNVGGPYPISAEGSFDGNRGQFVMRQPYKFSADGHLDGRSASLNVGGPYPISAEGSFDGNRGQFVMRQPYEFSADGHLVGRSASLNIGGMYPISAEGSFDGNRGQFVMRQPYEFSADGHLDGQRASLNVGGPYPVSVEGSFDGKRGKFAMRQPYEFSADGHLDGKSASLNIGGPYPVSAEGSFDGNRGQFVMRQPYEFSADGHLDGRSASLNVGGPYPISAEGSFDGNRGQFEMRQPYEFSADGHIDGKSASLNVGGPYPISAEGSLDGNRGQLIMRQPYQFFIDGHMDERSASVNAEGPYPISAEGSFDGTSALFVMRKPYPISINGQFDGRNAMLSMNGPIAINAEGGFDGSRGFLNVHEPYFIKVDGKLDDKSIAFQSDILYPISFSGQLGNESVNFRMSSPVEIDVTAQIIGTKGSLIMREPFVGQVGYTLHDGIVSGSAVIPAIDVEGTVSVSQNQIALDVTRPIPIKATAELRRNGVSVNMEEPLEFDGDLTLTVHSGELLVRQPMPIKVEYDVKDCSFRGYIMVDGRRDKSFELNIACKDNSGYSTIDKTGSITLVLPTRTVGLSTSTFISSTHFVENATFIWDQARERQLSVYASFNDRSRRSTKGFDLDIAVDTPLRSVNMDLQFGSNPLANNMDMTMKWDAIRDESKQMTITHRYTKADKTITSTCTLSSPLLSKDITMSNVVQMADGNVFFAFQHDLTYHVDTRNNLVMAVKLSDEGNTRYGNHNYTSYTYISHKASSIDIEVLAHAAKTDRAVSTGVAVNYMMAHGINENLLLFAEVNYVFQTINLQLQSPFRKAAVVGSIQGNTVTFVATDSENEIKATVQRTINSVEAIIYADPIDPTYTINIKGTYEQANRIGMTAAHGRVGQMTSDLDLTLDLQDDHLVRSRIYVRPSMYSDIKSAVELWNMGPSHNEGTLDAIRSAFAREFREKGLMIASNIDASSLMRTLTSEIDTFVQDTQTVKRAFNQMYWNNEFYLRSIDRAVTLAVNAVSDACSVAMEAMSIMATKIARYCKPVVEFAAEKISDVMDKITPSLINFRDTVVRSVTDICVDICDMTLDVAEQAGQKLVAGLERMAVIVEPYLNAYVSYFNQINAWMRRVSYEVDMFYHDIMVTLPWDEFDALVEDLQEFYIRYQHLKLVIANKLSELEFMHPIYDQGLALSDLTADVIKSMTAWNARVMQGYLTVLEQMHNGAAEVFNYIKNRQESIWFAEAISEIGDQVHWSYTYLDIEGKLQIVLDKVLHLAVELTRKNLNYLIDDWLSIDMDRINAFSPSEGVLDIQVYVPNEYPTFQRVPFTSVEWQDVYQRAKVVLDNWLPDNLNPWDVYYQYKPNSDIIQWIPPFEAIATIAGQHITTFDGRTLEFLGSCTYVLVRDVVDSTFTLFNNYDKQYLTLVSDNKQVDVSLSGRVGVDGEAVEAPYEYENTQITRQGDILKVEHARGFSLECDLFNGMCVFRMSGWYHGKVAGMMGTYTNEPTDDLTMSNGEMTDDLEKMAQSWEATGQCTAHRNLATDYPLVESRPSGRVCGTLFMSRLSPMRNCFRVVDPRPYLRACIHDMEETASDDRRGVCHVAAAYVARCHSKRVDVQLPRICMRGEEEVASPSADVVFVIEQKPCNNDIMSKLDSLAVEIDRSLEDAGLSYNRFGVVGFGGAGVHNNAHIQTVSGQVFASSRQISSIESTMIFHEGGDNTDALQAINMAIDYPFRQGAARSVVLITCSACSEQAINAENVLQSLKEVGIQLHVLVEHEFQVDSSLAQPKTSYLFGIDSTAAYTKNTVSDRNLLGDSELLSQLLPPSDKCANLAMATQGSFFNLQTLSESRVRTQKSFIDVLSRRIAKTATPYVQDSPLFGRELEDPQIFSQDKTFTMDFETYMRS